MDRRQFLTHSFGLAATLATPLAFAQSGKSVFNYKLKNVAQTDTGAPSLILKANESIKDAAVVMRRNDGEETRTKLGNMKAGQEKTVVFKQGKGSYSYDVEITGFARENQSIDATFSTEVHYLDPIALTIDKDLVRLAEGELVLGTNVPLEKVDIVVLDSSGHKLAERTQAIGGTDGSVKLTWSASSKDVGTIQITAHDIAGFWAGVVLEPYYVEIPHEDVVFDTGKSTWHVSEEAKLQKTIKLVKEALRKHKGNGLNVSMYVAGYTDTVGDAEANMKLSAERARAIGEWFQKTIVKVDVYIQGFGESVLAVKTAESVDEPRNRRAIYMLGNTSPPTSPQIPKADWKRI